MADRANNSIAADRPRAAGLDGEGPFAGEPAFILGNGPRLPLRELWLLDHFFTVGVNRIAKVFDPTVLIWVDASVGDQIAPLLERRRCLALCPEPIRPPGRAIGLDFSPGVRRLPRHAREICCDGNTGVAAAAWALSLGCRPVYLLGMEARYRDGATDFYGRNPHHRDGTLRVMQLSLRWLRQAAGDAVVAIHSGRQLIDAVSRHARLARDRETYRQRILNLLEEQTTCPNSSTT